MKRNNRLRYLLTLCSLLVVLCSTAQVKKTLYVADRFSTCDKNDCIQVKGKKKDAWKVFTDSIKGFNYEEGYEFKLSVNYSPDYNTYKLLKVVSKKKTAYNPALRLEGKKWVLVSMFDAEHILTLGDTSVFIKTDILNGRVSGHGVCNNLKGTLKAEGHSITFSELGYTRMKCIDQGNVMEAIINNLLSATNTYSLQGGKLTLYSNKGSYLVFTGL